MWLLIWSERRHRYTPDAVQGRCLLQAGIAHGSASNTHLRQLDSIHNSGLRLALGAFCTSQVSSLYTEANEAHLEERRLKLSMHYYLKTRACIDNPAHHVLHDFDWTNRDLYAPRPNGRGGMTRPPAPPVGVKVEEAMTSAEINAELVCPWGSARITWWNLRWWFQNEWVRAAEVVNRLFHNGETTCPQLYTDNTSIFAAETTTISLALNYYQHMGPVHHSVVVFYYSMSCLQAIGGRDTDKPYHESALFDEWQRHPCSFLLDTKPLWHWGKWKSGPTRKRETRPRY